MIKVCPVCKKNFEGNIRKKYCSPKCKKTLENSKRGKSGKGMAVQLAGQIKRPQWLSETAAVYWDKMAPVLKQRGHLNILSEDTFAELCDLHARLVDINKALNETNISLLQIDDKWDNKTGVETQSFKESALSDLKRKYSRLYNRYADHFYLLPKSNRGHFDMGSNEESKPSPTENSIFDA